MKPEFNHEETSDKSKLRDILIYLVCILKNVKFMKDKKDLVTFSVKRLKKLDNSVHNIIQHNLECSFAKGDYWDSWKNWKKGL